MVLSESAWWYCVDLAVVSRYPRRQLYAAESLDSHSGWLEPRWTFNVPRLRVHCHFHSLHFKIRAARPTRLVAVQHGASPLCPLYYITNTFLIFLGLLYRRTHGSNSTNTSKGKTSDTLPYCFLITNAICSAMAILISGDFPI